MLHYWIMKWEVVWQAQYGWGWWECPEAVKLEVNLLERYLLVKFCLFWWKCHLPFYAAFQPCHWGEAVCLPTYLSVKCMVRCRLMSLQWV